MRRLAVGSFRLVRSVTSGACELGPLAGASQASARPLSRLLLSGRRASAGSFAYTHTASAQEADASPLDDIAGTPHRHHPLPKPAETGGPLTKYTAGLKSGIYRPDPRQEVAVEMLQELYDNLQRAGASHQLPGQHAQRPRRRPSGLTIVDQVGAEGDSSSSTGAGDDTPSPSGRDGGSSGGFSWFKDLGRALGRGSSSGNGAAAGAGGSLADAPPAVRGLYMYGGVGCGKTMLMDIFVSTAPAHFKVVRTHFHDFMLEVHASLRRHARASDPLLTVADGIAARARVLALDELFVTDVADAAILNRLFGRLWERGMVLLATSNRQPDDLYKGGLQRDLFMPFIHRLKTQCRAHNMESPTDYRRLAQHQRGLYFVVPPTPPAAAAAGGDDPLMERFLELSGGEEAPAPARVDVMMGRSLEVPLAAGKACMFPFQELCGRPVAAADYLALTGAYHTLALRGVPVFGAANRSEAYRFVTLIDVMYEARTRLLVTAAAPPVDMFTNIITQFDAAKNPELASGPDVVVDDNLGFAKDRTISRLTEMQSLEYLLHHARQHEPSLVLALQEAHAKARQHAAASAAAPH